MSEALITSDSASPSGKGAKRTDKQLSRTRDQVGNTGSQLQGMGKDRFLTELPEGSPGRANLPITRGTQEAKGLPARVSEGEK